MRNKLLSALQYLNLYLGKLKYEKRLLLKVILILIFGIYAGLLFFHLKQAPLVFIDEAAYANEINSLILYGVDTHGYQNPIYFQGAYGGQSILGSLILIPFIKLFGFSILKFRIPFVLLNLLLILVIVLTVIKLSNSLVVGLLMELALIAMPWIYISARWILDCNFAPLFLMFGIISLIWGLTQKRWRKLGLILSATFWAMCAYGYVATWLYLPLFLLVLASYLLIKGLITRSEIFSLALLILVLVLPLIIFAWNVNIKHMIIPQKLLGITLPPLPNNRVMSLINLKSDHLLSLMAMNFWNGLRAYIVGSDMLPWNSLNNLGVFCPILFGFVLIGAFGNSKKSSRSLLLFRNIINISLLAFVPAMLIILPNYNHWNVINFDLAILIGFGFWFTWQWIATYKWHLILILLPLCTSAVIFISYHDHNFNYFNYGSQDQYQSINLNDIRVLDWYITHHPRQSFYIKDLSSAYAFFKLIHPLSPTTESQVNDQGSGNAPHYRYRNLIDWKSLYYIKHGDYLVIAQNQLKLIAKGYYQTLITQQQQYRLCKKFNYLQVPYAILQRSK